MPFCSTCSISTLLVGGITFTVCDHVICSFCAQGFKEFGNPNPSSAIKNQLPCPSKFGDKRCQGCITQAEIDFLLDQVASGNLMEVMVEEAPISKSFSLKQNFETKPNFSGNAVPVVPRSTPANLEPSVEGATALLGSLSVNSPNPGRNHQDLLVEKLMNQKGLTKEQAILHVKTLPLIENQSDISCQICMDDSVPVGHGVVLKECFHTFCKTDLTQYIVNADSAQPQCPFVDASGRCEMHLTTREIESLLVSKAEYERYLERMLQETEGSLPNTFHCRTPNCQGFCLKDEDSNRNIFRCPICYAENCLRCKALHGRNVNCASFQQQIARDEQRRNEELSEKTINECLTNQLYMKCPQCNYVIEKNGGCPHMTCKKCRHEFQWTGIMT